MRRCPKCGETKPYREFYASECYCMVCKRKLNAEWKQRNRQRYLDYLKEYRTKQKQNEQISI